VEKEVGVSVAEFPGQAPDDYPSQLDRTPPQDEVAEQSVLGAMLMSKDAIADVVESVRGTDFYRPAHETIYDAILDLYGRGEPADAVTVAAQLQRQGELGRVGGAPYLHTLVSGVPIAANAGYYAEIVREKAILRRLVDAGTRIAQWGYSGEGDVDDVVDRAQAEVYGVTDKRTSEDYAPLSDIMEGTLDEIEAISNRDGAMVGVPTGFADMDELTNGLHPGQMVILAARPAMGKALALDTPLPTPGGWTTMGEVQLDDELLGANGRPTRVVAATEVMHDHECYEVCFSDGSWIVADAQHQWVTRVDAADAPPLVCPVPRPTKGLRERPQSDLFVGWRTTAASEPTVSTTEHLSKLVDDGATLWVDDTRTITGVRRTRTVPVRCVEVDADDHLYLAGPTRVPTHNSTLGLDVARSASIKHGMASVIFSLEMSRNEITMRLLSAEARIALNAMRNGHMNDDDWSRLARKMGEVSSAPLFIDDSPNMTMMEIRAKARRLKQRHDLRLIVVDYLQLMQSGKRVESRQLEVSEFSRQLKLLAKELEVPVIAISQLNRGAEQRTDRRPMLSDLRESGSLEQDADMVVLIHREDAYERESTRPGEADLIVAKHRNGPTATVVVAFQGHYSRFVDMAH
jgi:replicative DNA helicase